MKKLFLHIGLHKTATTLLQKNVFPKGKIMYLGRYYPDNDSLHMKLHKNYFQMFNNLSIKKLDSTDQALLNKIRKDVIVSNESILRPFSFDNNILLTNLQQLNKMFDLHIILTIRNMVDIVISRFLDNQHLKPHTITLDNLKSSLTNKSCYAPFCKSKENLFNKPDFYLKYECICSNIKNINMKIYNKQFLQTKLDKFKLYFFELIGSNGQLQTKEVENLCKLLQLESKYFNTKVNNKKIQLDDSVAIEFKKIIQDKILQQN